MAERAVSYLVADVVPAALRRGDRGGFSSTIESTWRFRRTLTATTRLLTCAILPFAHVGMGRCSIKIGRKPRDILLANRQSCDAEFADIYGETLVAGVGFEPT
jgi:hypothetical protein